MRWDQEKEWGLTKKSKFSEKPKTSEPLDLISEPLDLRLNEDKMAKKQCSIMVNSCNF